MNSNFDDAANYRKRAERMVHRWMGGGGGMGSYGPPPNVMDTLRKCGFILIWRIHHTVGITGTERVEMLA